jgi:hypothetical protein
MDELNHLARFRGSNWRPLGMPGGVRTALPLERRRISIEELMRVRDAETGSCDLCEVLASLLLREDHPEAVV